MRNFNSTGIETGASRYYYESGKLYREIDFENGKIKDNSFVEYNEDGSKNKIFEENFNNNSNEWDLYMSDKSSAAISGGELEIISTSKAGTSRYINYPIESSDFTIEAVMGFSAPKDMDKIGIIYGFKDWQNYNYFAITKKAIYVGSFYEGVKSADVEAMYCSAINPLQNNVIKVLTTGGKTYFSVNGEIQYKDDASRLFGNNLGFVLSGDARIKVDKLIVKEMHVSARGASPSSPGDANVKATGSGAIFSNSGYIITNHHVVDNSTQFVIEMNGANGSKANYNAEVVIKDKDNDLAILKIKDPAFTPLPKIEYAFKENGLLDVGSTVFTIGYPYALSGMGKEAKFTDGKVSSKTGYNGEINSFQSSIPVQPGNSGGPVFNSNGQLVGVINASLREADNVAYAIKLNYIKNLIELLSDKVDLPSDNSMSNLTLEEKIKILTQYVVLIKVK